VRTVDRLLVMDEGHLVEQGPHAALWAAGGLYRKLCDLQEGVDRAASS
jgi:ATP-binding cassette subfamily B protein